MQCLVAGLVLLHGVSASLSWPSFLGGSTSSAEPTDPAPLAAPTTPLAPVYSMAEYAPGGVAQNYPIWRVHKYNGIHLNPVDMSQLPAHLQPPHVFPAVTDTAAAATNDETNYLLPAPVDELHSNDIGSKLPAAAGNEELPAELVQMALSLGITDTSKLPSLNEAMSLLGTTSAEETVKVIRDIASTENGMALIRQFLENNDESSEESDIGADQQQQPEVAEVEAPQEPTEPEQGDLFSSFASTLDRTNSNLDVLQRIVTPAPPASASTNNGGIFSIITNFFRPAPPAVSLDSLTEPPPTETPPTVPEPVEEAQPALATIQRILPPFNIQAADYDRIVRQYYGRPVGELRDTFTASFPTLQLPRLPDYPSSGPVFPANFQQLPAVPQLPAIRIPTYQAPSNGVAHPPTPGSRTAPAMPGTYIRVRYPLAAFQPNQHYQLPPQKPHQQYLPVAQYGAPNVGAGVIEPRFKTFSSATPPRAVIPASISAPIAFGDEPMIFELPRVETNEIINQLQPSTAPATTVTIPPSVQPVSDVSQLPLSIDNYNAFRNAPHIVTSYGTPALPFTFADDEEPAAAGSAPAPLVIRIGDDDVQPMEAEAQRRSGNEAAPPQRITAHDVVATGRLGRRADAAAIAAAIPTQRAPTQEYGE